MAKVRETAAPTGYAQKTGPLTAATYSEAILRYTRQRGGPFPILDSREESDRPAMRAWLGYWQHLGLTKRSAMMHEALTGRAGSTTYTVAERWPSEVTGQATDDRFPPSIDLGPVETGETGRLAKLPYAVRIAFEVARGKMSESEGARLIAEAQKEAAE